MNTPVKLYFTETRSGELCAVTAVGPDLESVRAVLNLPWARVAQARRAALQAAQDAEFWKP